MKEMWHWQKELDPRVSAAFDQVDRAHFLPEALRKYALNDEPFPIGAGQTISQPFVVAMMVNALNLQPGDRVLEIGTGSGYETAILCEVVAQAGKAKGATVYSVERLPELAAQAEKVLHDLDYFPHLKVGDGAEGWHEAAPFDAIIASAAALKFSEPWWDQLAEGGAIIAPIGMAEREQFLWLLRKVNGEPHYEELGGVRFVPLISPLMDA